MIKKKVMGFVAAGLMTVVMSMNAFASGNLKLSLDASGEFKYNTEASNGKVKFGDNFENIAPGETRTATMTLENQYQTADFYISTKTLDSFEEANAQGAVYEVKLVAGSRVIYDSALGGYVSTKGLEELDDILSGYVYVDTLDCGENIDVSFSITLDGESVDNAYMQKDATIDFDYQALFKEPEKVVVQQGESTTRVVNRGAVEYVPVNTKTIGDDAVALNDSLVGTMAAKTGDTYELVGYGVLLTLALIICVITIKRKPQEDKE